MVVTNRAIYSFKIKPERPLDYESLKTQFSSEKTFDNRVPLSDKDYSTSLTFEEENDGILFFILSKWDDHDITVSDFQKKKDLKSYLGKDKKVKNISLIAIIKNLNIMLVLYNHKAFRYSTATLYKYFAEKLGIEVDFEPLFKDYTEDEIIKKEHSIKHITLVKAQKNYLEFERKVSDTPRKKIKKYMQTNEEIIKIQRLSSAEVSDVIRKIFKIFKKKDYEKIIISGKNLGEIDLLEGIYLEFPCEVNVDSDALPIYSDFKYFILKIKSEHYNLLKSYSS